MEKEQIQDMNVDYDDYEKLEAEAEQLANTNPNAPVPPSGGARNTMARRRAAAAPVQEKSDAEQLEEIESESSETDGEVQAMEDSENMPKWVPFHQPEKIGIINSDTKEVMEGFKDEGTATGMAKILNEIDAIIVGGGYQ